MNPFHIVFDIDFCEGDGKWPEGPGGGEERKSCQSASFDQQSYLLSNPIPCILRISHSIFKEFLTLSVFE